MFFDQYFMRLLIRFRDIVSFLGFFASDKKWDKLPVHFSKPDTDSHFFIQEISLENSSIIMLVEFNKIRESTSVFADFSQYFFMINRSDFVELFIECSCKNYFHIAISRAEESLERDFFTFSVRNNASNCSSSKLWVICPWEYCCMNCRMRMLALAPFFIAVLRNES